MIFTQSALTAGVFVIAILLARPFKRVFGLQDERGNRYLHLDGLRAIAALSVVSCHVIQNVLLYDNANTAPTPTIGNQLGSLGVQIFFALTAFLFTSRALAGKLDLLTFTRGRARRILPLYFVACTLTIVIIIVRTWTYDLSILKSLVEGIEVFLYGFRGGSVLLFREVDALQYVGVAWTLYYEWLFYGILLALYPLSRTSPWAAAGVIVGIVLCAVSEYYRKGYSFWPFFAPGVFAAVVWAYLPPQSQMVRLLMGVVAVGVGYVVLSLAVAHPAHLAYSAEQLALVSLLFLTVLFSNARVLKFRPLRTLGQISYSVYLLQYLVLWAVFTLAKQFPELKAIPYASWGVGMAAVVILVPVSCASYQWIELRFMKSSLRQGLPLAIRRYTLDKESLILPQSALHRTAAE